HVTGVQTCALPIYRIGLRGGSHGPGEAQILHLGVGGTTFRDGLPLFAAGRVADLGDEPSLDPPEVQSVVSRRFGGENAQVGFGGEDGSGHFVHHGGHHHLDEVGDDGFGGGCVQRTVDAHHPAEGRERVAV